MGVVCEDLNGDGNFDLFVTHLHSETNTFFAGDAEGQFRDDTARSALGSPSLPYTGFGVAAVDVEHDGDLDLIVVNGRINHGATVGKNQSAGSYWSGYAEPAQLFLNDGTGRFTEDRISGGRLTSELRVARGLAAADIDGDGDLDLLVTACDGPARLFINDFAKRGEWLQIRLIGTRRNRDAIGAQIVVRVGERKYCREVAPCSSYLASYAGPVHFGLGPTDEFDSIAIRWPDGSREMFPRGRAGRSLVLREGTGRPASVERSP
jgi:hypothetical protein